MRLVAPAKLNLCLHITGKRSDGYHLLDSLVAFTAFGDVIEIHESDTLSLTITGEFSSGLKSDEGNLILRAVRMLEQHSGKKIRVHITLDKRIPIGAGLGGGSSDAATVLNGLCDFCNIDVPLQTLSHMALSLGSDVPVCVLKTPAWLEGVGDKITPVSFAADIWAVLVNLQKELLTSDVYRARSGAFSSSINHISDISDIERLTRLLAPLHNDLQAPAVKLLPEISEILTAIKSTKNCLLARMSGSGATCFGLYHDEEAALIAARSITEKNHRWWTVATYLKRTS